MSNWSKWWRGLVSAAIGAAANTITVMIIDPMTFNIREGLFNVLTAAGVSAGLAVAMYLKQSPLPGPKATTAEKKTSLVGILFTCLLIPVFVISCAWTGADGKIEINKPVLEKVLTGKAKQVGLLVGANNPGLYQLAIEKQAELEGYYDQGLNGMVLAGVHEAIGILVGRYVSDPLLQKLIVEEIKSMSEILGVDLIKIPDVVDLEKINIEFLMVLIDNFVTGLGEGASISG